MSKRNVQVTLTVVEISHILTALYGATLDGSYYGNRNRFYKRHARITYKLEESVKESERKEGRR